MAVGLFPNRDRSSFHRLRSFHLAAPSNLTHSTPSFSLPGPPPSPSKSKKRPFTKALSMKLAQARNLSTWRIPRNRTAPVPAGFIITFCVLLSLLFIVVLACTFRGADAGAPLFKEMLDGVGSGIVLIGDNVDVDVDEPAITIRWSIIACGDEWILPGSSGTHGSDVCGLPRVPLDVFVDGEDTPTASYDPNDIPWTKDTGVRRSVQNLVQFDSDHVLDVHKARLYPFDVYFLTSSIRLTSPQTANPLKKDFDLSETTSYTNSTPIPIQKIATLDVVTNFVIETLDMESYELAQNSDRNVPTRDLDMKIRRPAEARAIAFLLFGVSWVLTHVSLGHVFLARRLTCTKPILKHLASAGAILVALPHIRNSMPDAPGLDGFLIDTVGFFPQMIMTGMSIVALLIIVAARELAGHVEPLPSRTSPSPLTIFTGEPKYRTGNCPKSPMGMDFHDRERPLSPQRYDMERVVKSLRGEYVFPPLPPLPSPTSPTRKGPGKHRRVMTTGRT